PFSIASIAGQYGASATRSPSRHSSSCRSARLLRRQPRNAAAAARTASSTWSSEARATLAHSRPVLGSTAANRWVGVTSSPPITSPYSSGSDRSLRGTACATLAMVLAVVGVLGRGDVERGVLVEEPEGLELEADVMDGHHGPVLRSREV